MAHNGAPGDTLYQSARNLETELQYWIFLPVAPVTIAVGMMLF